MKYTAVEFDNTDKKSMKRFLKLPKKLYGRYELMQNKETEYELLNGSHILSRYFSVYPFIAVDQSGEAVARCVLTIYPDKDEAYIGYFESINDIQAAECILESAENKARQLGRSKILGPVDCSFWIGYRLKTNHFGSPYTNEPYNKEYYEELWLKNNYNVCGEYVSNKFKRIPDTFRNEKAKKRLAYFSEKGYRIISPSEDEFKKCLNEVYSLMIELYSNFQTYSRITQKEFYDMYMPLKKIADYSMIKMAYYNEKPVGFFISVPDFGNAVSGSITPVKLARILKTKLMRNNYVILYMGAESEHRGLGNAMAETVCQELSINGAHSVGALIRKGKITESYFSKLIEFQYEYKLYEKIL